jgi:hypothetical protein
VTYTCTVAVNMPDLREELAEYAQHVQRSALGERLADAGVFGVVSCEGWRLYVADDFGHAREQHCDAFPEEGEPFAVVELQAPERAA